MTTIRLFISSTFQDMTEERDMLNRIAFPQLREYCRKRGLGFVGLDLRWGITEDDTKNNRTLEICLSEIDRSRPYFAGIIGNRYGWIPPKELYEAFDYDFPKDISITEAEILYGAFSQHKMNAVFCIKKQDDDCSCDDNEKLNDLRNRILDSDYPKLKNYQAASEVADFLVQQLTEQIESDFPDRVFIDNYQMETIRQEDFLIRETESFSGRLKDLHIIEKFLNDKSPLLSVDSAEGGGKTALLAAFLNSRTVTDDTFQFYFFKEALSQGLSWDFTLKRLIKALCFKIVLECNEPETTEQTVSLLADTLWRASRVLKRIILVFDGIDTLSKDAKYGIAWLPEKLPPQVKIIFSSSDPVLMAALLNRGAKICKIDLLNKSEKKLFIDRYLLQYGKKLDKRFVPLAVSTPMSGNPRFLRTLLSELTVWNSYETLRDRLEHYVTSTNLTVLYEKVLIRIETEYDRKLVRDTLALLCVSNYGLSETEITSALKINFGLWMPVLYAIKPHLFESGSILFLSDSQLRETVRRRYLSDSFTLKIKNKLIKALSKSKLDTRQTRLLFELLYETDRSDRLYSKFTSPDIFSNLWKESPYWLREIHNHLIRSGYEPSAKLLKRTLTTRRINTEQLFNVAEYLAAIGQQSDASVVLDRISAKKLSTAQKIEVLTAQGNIFLHLGRYALAQKSFEEKQRFSLFVDNRLEYARASASLGQIALADGNIKRAEKSYKLALSSFEKCFYPNGIQAAFGNLGNVFTLSGELAKAMKMYRKQEQKCAETCNFDGQNNALNGQLVVALKLDDLAECDHILVRQKRLCEKYGNIKGLELAIGNQALVAYKKGFLDEARRLLEEKLRLAEATGHFEGQLTAYTNLADLYYEEKQVPQAIEYEENVVRICRRNRNKERLYHSLVRLSFFYAQTNQQKKADIASTEASLIEQMLGAVPQDLIENALMISQVLQKKEI